MSDQLQARGVSRAQSQQPQQRPSNQQTPGNPGGLSPQRQQQQQQRPGQGLQVQRPVNPQQIIARIERQQRPSSPLPRRPSAPDASVILGMVGAYAKGGRDGVVAGYEKGLDDGFKKGFLEGLEAGYKLGIRDTVMTMLR